MGAKNHAPSGIGSPESATRSESLYRVIYRQLINNERVGLFFQHLPDGSDNKLGNVCRGSHFWRFCFVVVRSFYIQELFQEKP
jgi:hypothetical protein